MEEQEKYSPNDFGKIPNSSKIEVAYALSRSAMDLTLEGTNSLARSLKGEKVREQAVRSSFHNAATILRVAQDLIQMETWSYTDGDVIF